MTLMSLNSIGHCKVLVALLLMPLISGRVANSQEAEQPVRSAESHLAVDSITVQTRTDVSLEFVFIPPGTYTVGREIGKLETFLRLTGQEAAPLNEGPERSVTFDRGFYLARRQVTAEQFARFLNDVDPEIAAKSIVLNARSNLQQDAMGRYSAKSGRENYPANTVAWDGAIAFTNWFTETSGWSLRLPTEEEWEAAARGPRGDLGPTGGPKPTPDPKTGLVPGIRPGSADAAVDAYPENMTASGLFHTVNWVADWTSSVYHSDRDKTSTSAIDVLVVQSEGGHVLKGRGSLTARSLGKEVGEDGIYGFRPVLEANEEGSAVRKARPKVN